MKLSLSTINRLALWPMKMNIRIGWTDVHQWTIILQILGTQRRSPLFVDIHIMINVDNLRAANNKQMSRCRKENGEKQKKGSPFETDLYYSLIKLLHEFMRKNTFVHVQDHCEK